MAGRPGVIFTRRARRVAPGISTDTGQAFFVGFAEKGLHTQVHTVHSVDDYEDALGGGDGVNAALYDAVETFFGEGGAVAHVGRVVGLTPVVAKTTVQDGSAVNTIRFEARSVGAWGNYASGGYRVTVAAGSSSGKKVTVTLGGTVVETHDNLATVAAIVTAVNAGDHLTAVNLASGSGDPLPANGPSNLTTGTDDNGTATDAEWATALALFSIELGPGQVLAPGRTTAVAHGQLLDHAGANNRSALLDVSSDASKTTLTAAADAAAALTNAERGMLVGTWLNIPQATAGVNRSVPGSAFAAGVIARHDGTESRDWPIGRYGVAQWALSAVSEFSDADREDLTDVGVNVVLDDPNGLRLYGFRSVSTNEQWRNFAHQRLMMEVEANALALGEQYVGSRITPATIDSFGGAIEGYLQGLYVDGALVGDTAEEAYRVDVDSVNTDETAEAGELHAAVYLRASEHAELVRIVATKVPVTSSVA